MNKSVIIILLLGFLVFLLPFGSSTMNILSKANAIEDYRYEADQYEDYATDMANDNYDKSQNSYFIKKIKCNNINSNFNGVEANTGTSDPLGIGFESIQDDASETWFGNGEKNNGNFDVDCINNNNNIVIEEEPVPPTPPTVSLTVNKEIFGCNNMDINNQMSCSTLQNDSPLWLPCIGSSISSTPFCQNLPPNLFDIEVLGQIQEFEGSTAGTTIQNLQTDTFRVNEIVHEEFANQQLFDSPTVDRECKIFGFDGGGELRNLNTETFYQICFEYEDQQGNDCNPITIGAEEQTCTVKNHIRFGFQNPV